MIGPQSSLLPNGKRLHLNHGPIDLVIEAFGDEMEIAAAYRQAVTRFQSILTELVAELELLRQPYDEKIQFNSVVAQTMHQAISPYQGLFITPMAAVAGAVAEHILDALLVGRQLDKAYVNNGGDIALNLTGKSKFDVGMIAAITPPTLAGKLIVFSDDKIGGIATSGRHGRSLSLGIADAVCVLAATATQADVAATLIANHVNLGMHPAISRAPAYVMDPDSDLGAHLVTEDVGSLTSDEINEALKAGQIFAEKLLNRGLISAASLCLRDEMRFICRDEIKTRIVAKELVYA